MAQTIAEKLFSRHNLAGAAVPAGDMLVARIDGAMVTLVKIPRAIKASCEARTTDGRKSSPSPVK